MVIVEIPSNIALTLAVYAALCAGIFCIAYCNADAMHRVIVALLWGGDDDESDDEDGGAAAPTDDPYTPPRAGK